MTASPPPDRCRLVLITPAGLPAPALKARLAEALAGGDVASVIVPQYGVPEPAFQELAEALVPVVQAAGAAAVLAGETRIADRVGADGVHLDVRPDVLGEAVSRLRPPLIVGAGAIRSREDALACGELQPDYVFFGRFGYDTRAEPHPRNLALAEWWAEMIEIPCIVLGGSAVGSVEAAALTGADFAALSQAVFGADADPAAAVAAANALLDEKAPRFTG